MTHTPGPWRVFTERFEERGDVLIDVVDAQLNNVCEFSNDKKRDLANARLIAAAPTLLQALKDILRVSEIQACVERERAVAAIALAEGQDASR